MPNTVNTCSAIHTTIGEMFVISIQPSYEHKGMFDLMIEGEGKNTVFITGTKEDLSRIGFSMMRCINNAS
jgi:hypothetical protein